MDVYKELIEELEKRGLRCGVVYGCHSGLYEAAADAIERLVKERDAAVADLKELSYCSNCELCTEQDGGDCWCSCEQDWFQWNDSCFGWEWRGVQEVANENQT